MRRILKATTGSGAGRWGWGWERIRGAIADAYGGDMRMIDGASVRVHHSAVTIKKPPGSLSWTKPERFRSY